MSDTSPEQPDTWAIVELMGHVTIIGRTSETSVAGAPMLRVDRIDGRVQRVSPQALYRLTDVTEAEARAAWMAQTSWSGSRGLPNALTQGDAWSRDEDMTNRDVDPDACDAVDDNDFDDDGDDDA